MNPKISAVSSESCAPCFLAPKKEFAPDKTDFIFALVFACLGFLYLTFITDWHIDWLFQAFTLAYPACVLAYLYAKKIKVPVLSYFWLGVFLLVSGTTLFAPSYTLSGWQQLCVHGIAVYWTLYATGKLTEDKTGNFLPLDLLQGFILTPFGNFFKSARVIWYTLRKTKSGKRAGAVALGFVFCLVIFAVILPLLSAADVGFAAILSGFAVWFNQNCLLLCVRLVLMLPVWAWLYGLVFGCVNGDCIGTISPDALRKTGGQMRVLPITTVCTALAGVCAAYALFIALQGKYLFGGFFGAVPDFTSVAQYARSGFFELCRIAAVNLGILLAANLFGRVAHSDSRALRILNTILCALSLLLVSTAFAKMALYIGTFGLTPKRVLAAVGLVWFAVVFVCALAGQWRRVAVVRVAAVTAAILLCCLSISDFDDTIAAYNAKNGFDNVSVSSYNDFE